MAKKTNWMKFLRYFNLAFSFGITMILAMLLGFYAGEWLDRRLGTSPLFILLGIFLGMAAGFYNLWSVLSKLMQENQVRKLEEEEQYEMLKDICQNPKRGKKTERRTGEADDG